MPTAEQRTITVNAYRTPDGAPTCCRDWTDGGTCQFMLTRTFGLVEVCGVKAADIKREDGWLRPVDGCPVWG